ncbi:hypothetical protein DFH11DRAFT_1168538 [Phellopilus nigrolimitatus]|nr:hypothetical protein DFH11DRAFT_1168538 [Phellopilus nigrolimitatus]
MDIYCRKAILEALSTTRYARTPEFAVLIKTQEVQSTTLRSYQFFNRHCDADGKLVHVCDPSCSEKRTGETKYHLNFDLGAVLQLRVQRGEAFSIAGHRPIVAGCTTNEELAYIAMACYSKRYGQRHYACAVTEGTKPENLRFQVFDYETGRSRMRAPESFVVYVLRYEAAAYANIWDLAKYGADGLDPTGPFAWRPMKQEDISPPQAFVEEVQADREGSESDEEDAETDSEENELDEEVWETADEGSVFSTD